MRTPNYKVGWIIPGKLAALTHFHSDITPEDIMGVFSETQKLLENVDQHFHILIDNRLAPLEKIYSLEELQHFSPFLRHPFLNHLVIVKPEKLKLEESQTKEERQGNVCLKNVSSIQEAFNFFQETAPDFDKDEIDQQFFSNQ